MAAWPLSLGERAGPLAARLLRLPGMARIVLMANRVYSRWLRGGRGEWSLYFLASWCVDEGLIEPALRLRGRRLLLLDPVDFMQREMLIRGVWEPETTRTLRRILRPGHVFIDVGANIGYFSLIGAAQVGRGGRVHAFEPVPRLCSRLRTNVAGHPLANVVVHEMACWSRDGGLTLYESDPSNSGKSSVSRENAQIDGSFFARPHQVRAVTLDGWSREAGVSRIDLLKVDVEGGEIDVLRGSRAILQAQRPTLIVEFEPRLLTGRGSSADELFRFLRGIRYTWRILDKRSADADPPWSGNLLAIPLERSADMSREILSRVTG